MRAELVGVGTELLLGQIANTNAQKISAALAAIGVDVYFHTVVGDNMERIHEVLERAVERSDVVIITGGLGPTPDDLTREAVAATLRRKLVRDASLVAVITGIFERFGRDMPEQNLRQADVPEGAVVIEPEGTAPGFFIDHDSSVVVALPGVPWEMEAMLRKVVIPMVKERAGGGAIVSREILVVGLGESHTHQRIADIVDAQTNPTIAFLAGGGQVRVRITAKAADDAAAVALIAPVERQLRERLGDAAIPGYASSLTDALGRALRERGVTIAAAESLTGGMIGATLTEMEGASDYFKGSLVVYATEAKRIVAGVDEAVLAQHGAVSEPAARALAEAAAERFGADVGVAATGVAGPAEQEGYPAGTLFVAATHAGRTEVRKVRGRGDRAYVRTLAVTAALELARRLVSETA